MTVWTVPGVIRTVEYRGAVLPVNWKEIPPTTFPAVALQTQ